MAAVQSEVAKSLDLEILRYSKVWEDHRVLEEALDIGDEDTVLSITSSGDNTLNLLLKEPKAVVAVDMSVAQNSLLELKLAAIKHLQYSEFGKLLGVMDASEEERTSLYDAIRGKLPSYAKSYLDQHKDFIASGISQCGRLDQYLGKFASEKVPSVISSEELDRFFSASSLEEQAALFKSWPDDKVKQLIRDVTSRANQSSKARSESQLKHVALDDEEIFQLFWRRFSHVCQKVPAADNFYLSWYMRGAGHYNLAQRQDFYPPYLREESFQRLKVLVDRITVVCSTLEDYLLQPNATFSKANLTDLFEYMDEEAMEKLYRLLVLRCCPGGRLAYWNLLCPRQRPSSLRDKVQPLSDLAAQLHSKDRVFFYSAFEIDEILP